MAYPESSKRKIWEEVDLGEDRSFLKVSSRVGSGGKVLEVRREEERSLVSRL